MKYLHFPLIIIALVCSASSVYSQTSWPKQLSSADVGTVTFYEPEYETFSEGVASGRAAVSIKKTAGAEPVFGAVLFHANIAEKSSSAQIANLNITNAKFPGLDLTDVEQITHLIEDKASGWQLGMSTNDLSSKVEESKRPVDAFNNAAPKIIYASKPSTLVVLDGQPQVVYDKELGADKVVNSPYLIFKEGKRWNLYVGGQWYQSSSVTAGWTPAKSASAKLKAIDEQIKKQEQENKTEKPADAKPVVTDIIVSTEPAELLQTKGEPEYKNVAGTSLLYVANSPNEIFKDINTQNNYILLAGRWYSSKSISGPWSYVAADQLPEDFARIPDGSEKETVLPNVAGTEEATAAKLDAAVPQTAKVDRKTATIDVEYDGEPLFNRVEGTSLRLAENSNVTVMIDASGNYFALDNGIWFISDDPYGPWIVANDRPRDVEDIPASSRAYHTKYVHVYDYTSEYVYMGYTPGYLGSYIYGPTIVYGTGYHYRPWFRRYYYPRPVTWGFGFIYDPWYGWNINVGYHYGFVHIGFNFHRSYPYAYHGGWFGPSRYYPVCRPYWGGGYYGRNYARRDYYRRDYYGARDAYGARRPAQSPGRPVREIARNRPEMSNNNIYRNQAGVVSRDVNRTARIYRPAAVNASAGGASINRPQNNSLNQPQNGVRYPRQLPGRNGAQAPANENVRPTPNTGQRPSGSIRSGRDVLENRNNRTGEQPDNIERNNDRPVTPGSRPVPGNNRIGERNGENNAVPSDRNVITPQRAQQPQRTEQPAGQDRPQMRERPSIPQRPAPSERPSVTERPEARERPSAPQRPAVRERPAPAERPQMRERPSIPQRPSVNERPSAPQRPQMRERPAVRSERPSAPVRSNSSRGSSEQGSRPARR